MPYHFSFDLTSISRKLFDEIARIAETKKTHKVIGAKTIALAKRLKIFEMTGLDISEATILIEDLVDVFARNISERKLFEKTTKRALFLSHCSRKYMDNRCKAKFDSEKPTYVCSHCSPDCLINQSCTIAEKKGYDVYVVPGGSCISSIIKRGNYNGVVGVACSQEIKLANGVLNEDKIYSQGLPLFKNGCCSTQFSVVSLEKIL